MVIGYVSDLLLSLKRRGLYRNTVNENISVLEGVNTHERLDRCTFARSVRAKESVNLTCVQRDGQIIYGFNVGA